VLKRDVERLSYLGSYRNQVLVTVIEAVNGGGTVIPLMVILPRKAYQEH
jgi:hypothetical protein